MNQVQATPIKQLQNFRNSPVSSSATKKIYRSSLSQQRKRMSLSNHKIVSHKQNSTSFHTKKKSSKQTSTGIKWINKKSSQHSLSQDCSSKVSHQYIQRKSATRQNITRSSRRTNINPYKSQSLHQNSKTISIPDWDYSHHENFVDKMVKILFSRFGERDKYFSYCYHIVSNIYEIINKSKGKANTIQIILTDLQMITNNIYKNRTFISTKQKQKQTESFSFEKNQNYFKFQRQEIRILLHVLAAQMHIYQGNIPSAITQLQFCQYYSRKQNLIPLTICFLWQNANCNISLLNYQQADLILRNIIQLAVINKNKNIIQLVLEKISLVYYYRGNLVMGQYYSEKVFQGLTPFQAQIYIKQYSKDDEILRLQSKLFKKISYEKITKRKNNPKFEEDLWRASKQQFEKQAYEKYITNVNHMFKYSDSVADGKKIKKFAAQVGNIGEIYKLKKGIFFQKQNKQIRESKYKDSGLLNYENSLQEILNSVLYRRNCRIAERAIEQNGCRMENNVNYVIKTHLSINRENNKVSRYQRWGRFISFLYALQKQLKKMLNTQTQFSDYIDRKTNHHTENPVTL